jgi:hypothetical protein
VVLGGHLSDCGQHFLWSSDWSLTKMKEKQVFFSTKFNDVEVLAEAEEYDVVMYGKHAAWSKF